MPFIGIRRLILGDMQFKRDDFSSQLLFVAFLFLTLSVTWNSIFKAFGLHYSRANLWILIWGLVVCLGLILLQKQKRTSIRIMKHVVVLFYLFLLDCLYFGSGFTEAWTFFLILPIITGLYGQKVVHFGYGSIGFFLIGMNSLFFPLNGVQVDSIDASNRLLLYIIITTFSYLVLRKLRQLYQKQMDTITQSMEVTIEQVVQTFVVAVEAKDIYTFGHSERVAKYTVELAKLLPEYQDEKKLHQLYLTGLLHDIGKINIPESILTKPSGLTEQEYELIKTHTVVGAKMVEKVKGLEALKAGVLYHHERWDGKGYPTMAMGTDIPLEARILAIADAFDAMTSSRAYRNALSAEEALDRIRSGKGTQFDPHIVPLLDKVQFSWYSICHDANNELDEFEKVMDLF